jgi:hypothetical protein
MEMQDQQINHPDSEPRVEEILTNVQHDVEEIIMDDHEDADHIYRMVNKEYYCYVC